MGFLPEQDTGGVMVRKIAAELLGTGFLVYFGVGVATLSFGFGTAGFSFAAGVVATALAFGLVLLVLAYVLGPISGCHINPAITMGVWLSGRIPLIEAVYYWVAEFVGAILGALLLWGTFSASPLYSRSKTGLGTNGWGAASHIHINAGGAFLVEVVMTALFVGGTALSQVWLFIVAPLVGGAVAAGLHRVLYPESPIEPLASGELKTEGA